MTVQDWLGTENQLGIDIWTKKYQYNGETFDEWLDRVSNGNKYVKQLIIEKKFLFGGRILANRGLPQRNIKTTYSNCYVLTVDDSIESIYRTCGEIARTFSYGGGVGLDLSKLRPRGAVVHNSAKETTGAVSFMKTFDTVTGTIGQNGRRGALMLSLSVNHPDIMEFVDIKANTDQITNANISVRMTDSFMYAVQIKAPYYILNWPCTKEVNLPKDMIEDMQFDALYEKDGVYYKKIDPVKLFHKLAENNWNYGEPGILYWDRITDYHLMSEDDTFEYAGVNPCAEEPLPDGGACLLGSLNLAAFDNFEDETFLRAIHNAVIGLNEVLEEGKLLHPLPQQRISCDRYHQIGLGIFGLGDTLIKNKLVYGTPEACDFAQDVLHTILVNAFIASCDLNKDQKIKYEGMFDSVFYKRNILPYLPDAYKYVYPKNSQIMTIAPTGTLSTMLGVSGGAEPNFAFEYYRTTKSLHGKDETYTVHHPLVDKYLEDNVGTSIEELPEYFITAGAIPIENRVKMQASLQEVIDASISSTANLKESVTVQSVEDLYFSAWKQGLKGITVFRDNCKRVAILSTHAQQDPDRKAPKRPKVLDADWYQITAKGQLFNVFVGLYEGKPYEIFAKPTTEKLQITNGHGTITKIQKGVYKWENSEDKGLSYDSNIAIEDEDSPERVSTLLASLGLRHGADIKYIVKTLKKTNPLISSFTAAMIRVLNKYNDSPIVDSNEICPECGKPLKHEGGCKHCDCGYSACMIAFRKRRKR